MSASMFLRTGNPMGLGRRHPRMGWGVAVSIENMLVQGGIGYASVESCVFRNSAKERQSGDEKVTRE